MQAGPALGQWGPCARTSPAPASRTVAPPTATPPRRAFKDRFRTLASGEIKYQRAGHVHKRFNKSNRQRLELKQTKLVATVFAKKMKQLGFTSRFY